MFSKCSSSNLRNEISNNTSLIFSFNLQADGPDPSKIPESEIVGVTVLLLKCRYMEQEFINIGWFVATEYTDPEFQEEPPASPVLEKVLVKSLFSARIMYRYLTESSGLVIKQ